MRARCAQMCHNIHMSEKTSPQPEVIEPEILDEQGLPVSVKETAQTSQQNVYRGVGVLTGFFALAFSFIMILLGALVTVFIIAPLLLLGRVLGLQIKNIRR